MAKRIAKLDKPFVNRIIGHGEERVDQMLANPLNFRLHPDNQQQALAGSIDDIGFIRSVTVNKRTGRVVDGHLRVTLAARSEVESLPVEYVDLTEAEEAQALLSLDPIAGMAASDKAKLDELMRAVQSDDERVQQMMADLAEREGMEYGREAVGEDPGAQVDRAEKLREKWGVESGQLWKLGEHRLVCGDCTDRAVVERLMGGDKASLVFTDPPYNFEMPGGGCFGGDKTARVYKDVNRADLMDFSPEAFLEILPSCFEKDKHASFIFCNKQLLPDYLSWAKQNKLGWNVLVWKKKQIVPFGDGHLPDVEYLIYFRKNATWNNGTDANRSKVLEYPTPNGDHPTIKPVELVENELVLTTNSRNIVIDFYSGSGTTLIACERLSRKCRAIEISPAYVAVTLQRWADMTGKTPELITT